MWQCRLEFQHSGFEALEESFSKTLHELSRANRITHMNFQNESLFHFRRLQHGVKKTLYNVIWVCEVTALLKKSEKSLDSILQFLWQSSVYPETIVMLLTSYTDTVTWVTVLTGNVICSYRASLWVRTSLVCTSVTRGKLQWPIGIEDIGFLHMFAISFYSHHDCLWLQD